MQGVSLFVAASARGIQIGVDGVSRQSMLLVLLSVEAHTLVLVAVTVTTLCKLLLAVLAGEGAGTLVRSYMVHHVAQLRERLVAGQTHQDLIEAARLFI